MKRKLSFVALQNMDGHTVWVHDLVNDCYDQECVVKVNVVRTINPFKNKKKKIVEFVESIELINEEFRCVYGLNGKCLEGDFEVYVK